MSDDRTCQVLKHLLTFDKILCVLLYFITTLCLYYPVLSGAPCNNLFLEEVVALRRVGWFILNVSISVL